MPPIAGLERADLASSGGQSAVVIALGTVETTRLALTSFQQSLAGRAAQRMGTNLVAHLRSNLTIRIPRKSIESSLPPDLDSEPAMCVQWTNVSFSNHRFGPQ